MSTHAEVVVVGAGLSGLVASAVLSNAGQRVLCLESRGRVGGRALSIDSTYGPVDLGATWFWPGERGVQSLVRELAVPTFEQHLDGDTLLESSEPAGVRRLRGNLVDVASFRFGDGTQYLVKRLAATLPAGVVRCDSPVRAVSAVDDGVRVTTETETVAARAVVIAVPPATAVARIDFTGLDPQVADVAARTAVWMGDVVKAVAVYDTPFWRARGLAGAAVSYQGPFREFHDMTGADGATPALFGFAPAPRFAGSTDEQIRAGFVDQLVGLYGEAARPSAVYIKDWSREPWTVPSSPAARSTEHFGHPLFGAANPSDRILWASTETADDYAGHLEGAINAGVRAANTVRAVNSTVDSLTRAGDHS